jgi:hypothetical protein
MPYPGRLGSVASPNFQLFASSISVLFGINNRRDQPQNLGNRLNRVLSISAMSSPNVLFSLSRVDRDAMSAHIALVPSQKASAKLKSAKELFSGHAMRKGKALNGAQRWND